MKTFVLLYESGSVTCTGRSSTSPSSVSHSLSRLRRQLSDPLFVRSANGLVPTDTARQLYPEIRVGLEVIEAAVAGATHFDPATSNRTFRILATDLGEIALLPSVLTELETRAPRVRIEIVPLDTATAAAQLQQGRADAVICAPRLEDPDLRRDVLVREHYICLCAKDHPRITGEPTLSAYLGERHLSVDAPSASAEWSLRAANVRIFTLPVDVREVEVSLYTYDRRPSSPAIDWLRSVICAVRQQL
jgi:DNA-binding transcriptional LysR family regulator